MADGNYEIWVALAGKEGDVQLDIRRDDIVKRNKMSEDNLINRFNDAE